MPVQKPWDKYEAVILLDALLQIKNGASKKDVIKRVSTELRQKAINQGFDIDEIFRNENGISFQLQSMDSAYEQINKGKPATKLFSEIAEIYRTDNNYYLNILNEAKLMTGNLVSNELDTDSVFEELYCKCHNVLKDNFEDGYRIGNYMHKMRFISCYQESYGENILDEINDLDMFLKTIGQVIDDRIFFRNNEDSCELLKTISTDIENVFSNGASVIFIDCLFEKYRQRLMSEMNVYNPDTFRNILMSSQEFLEGYYIERNIIYDYQNFGDVNSDVKNILKNSPIALTYEDIRKELWYIPFDKIKIALRQIPESVNVENATYFYAPNFNISSSELSALANAMHSAIYSNGYLVSKNLRNLFRDNCPSAAMDSEGFKDYGIKEILKTLLNDKFDFKGSVITEKGSSLDIGQVYQNFAAAHEKVTLEELKELQNDLGVSFIYWDKVMKEMIRISANELVCKNSVHFNIEAIDKVLELLCHGDYIALKDVKLFLSFPAFEYRWNGFVLESYLRDYSKKFRLVQLSVANDDYFGIMIRNTSPLKSYNDIASDMLARRTDWSDEKSALKCLVNSGFQQRAANKNIQSIIKMAKLIREKI